MKNFKVIILALVLLILAGCVATAIAYPFIGRTDPPDVGNNDPGHTEPGGDPDPDPNDDPQPEPEPEPDPNIIPRPQYVRGLFLTGRGANSAKLREPIIQLLRDSELNSLVINVKDDEGYITYKDTNVQLALDAGANMNQVNMRAFMETLREEQIYPIARIVVAKDKLVSKVKPQWFFQNKSGGVWKGKGETPWADLRNKEYWDYLLEIAVEAVEIGFREIQFDYVRWPSGGDGGIKNITDLLPANMTLEGPYPRSEIIAEFLSYTMDKLAPYDVEVSVDTFGIMGIARNEQAVGQHFETILSSELDIVCPMIYPSHFANNTYGQPNPNRAPYEVVYQNSLDHLNRIEAAGAETILRPWLQDFNHWDDPQYKYGVEQIHAQLRALKELGIKEYLFWNAGNKYTEEAFKTWQSE